MKNKTIILPSYWLIFLNPNEFWFNTLNIGKTIIVTKDMFPVFVDKVPIEEWSKFITYELYKQAIDLKL